MTTYWELKIQENGKLRNDGVLLFEFWKNVIFKDNYQIVGADNKEIEVIFYYFLQKLNWSWILRTHICSKKNCDEITTIFTWIDIQYNNCYVKQWPINGSHLKTFVALFVTPFKNISLASYNQFNPIEKIIEINQNQY